MNSKTLISALTLSLALGSLVLPGMAAARDYGHERDHQVYSQSRHHNDRRRHEHRHHQRDRHEPRRDRHEHRRHDRDRRDGWQIWFGFPYSGYGYFDYGYNDHRHHHHRDHYSPRRIIRIDPRW